MLMIPTGVLCAAEWERHVITEGGFTFTVVAADFTGDGKMDVISSPRGKVVLYEAPSWKPRMIHEFEGGRKNCIHSEAFDVDGDGDQDYVGAFGHGSPFWLERPDSVDEPWTYRVIDPDVSRAHCVLKADINKDGKLDLLINQFSPEGKVANSLLWLEVPEDVKAAPHWTRHILADQDAVGGSHYFGFGDIDGDGWGEVAIGAKGKPFENGNWFSYWKNPGADEVNAPWAKVLIADEQEGATNIAIGDLNGDEKPDFLASLGHGKGVVWFEAPSWKRHVIDAEMECPHSLVLADLDGDGDLDGASCGFKSQRVSV